MATFPDIKPSAVLPKYRGVNGSFKLSIFPGDSWDKWAAHGGRADNFRVAINDKFYITATEKYVFFTQDGLAWFILQHLKAGLGLTGPAPAPAATPALPKGAKVFWRREPQPDDDPTVMGNGRMIETFLRTEPFQDDHGEWVARVMFSGDPVRLADLRPRFTTKGESHV